MVETAHCRGSGTSSMTEETAKRRGRGNSSTMASSTDVAFDRSLPPECCRRLPLARNAPVPTSPQTPPLIVPHKRRLPLKHPTADHRQRLRRCRASAIVWCRRTCEQYPIDRTVPSDLIVRSHGLTASRLRAKPYALVCTVAVGPHRQPTRNLAAVHQPKRRRVDLSDGRLKKQLERLELFRQQRPHSRVLDDERMEHPADRLLLQRRVERRKQSRRRLEDLNPNVP